MPPGTLAEEFCTVSHTYGNKIAMHSWGKQRHRQTDPTTHPIDQPWAIYDLCRPIDKLFQFELAIQRGTETTREGIAKI